MNLFLDTSVLLAACGSAKGSSRAIFNYAPASNWILLASPYVLAELDKNIRKLPRSATEIWADLRQQLAIMRDVVSIDRAVLFSESKDRPILFTALAWSDTLITLDRTDFTDLLGREFYGLHVRLPYEFLREERAAGRLTQD